MDIVVIGIGVPSVLITTVTSVRLGTSVVVRNGIGLEGGLDTSAINFSGVSEVVILGQTELGDELRTEDGTASTIAKSIHCFLKKEKVMRKQNGKTITKKKKKTY